MTRPLRYGLAVTSGIFLALGFPRFDLWWFAMIGLFPLLLALQLPGHRESTAAPKEAFRLGWVTGSTFFLILLYWLPQLPQENLTVPFLMYPALLLVSLYYGLFAALTAWGSSLLARRGAPLWLCFPGLWVLAEYLRTLGFMGFTWGVLAYAMAPVPHLIQFASVTGTWGVSLWLVLLPGLVHGYFGSTRSGSKAVLAVLFLGGLFIPRFHGLSVLEGRQIAKEIKVGLVQPNTGKNKWQPGVRDSVVAGLLYETQQLHRQASGQALELMIWPETAVPARLPREANYLYQVEALVDEIGVPLLAGYPDGTRRDGEWRFTNSAGLLLPGQGIVQQYDKRHLVPFSEYSPIPIMKRYDFGQANFSKGDQPPLFTHLGTPFGVLICFESGFSPPCRRLVQDGARFLVNITNDQWFGDSAAPYQHFNLNVLRCIENRVSMARAANTGVSGVIDPYGLVRTATPTFISSSRVASVELGSGGTFYTRTGDWPLAVAALMVVMGAGAGLVSGSRR